LTVLKFVVEPSTSQTSENIRDKRTSGEVFTLSSVPKTSEKTTIPSEPKPQQNNHQIPDIQKPQQLPSNLRSLPLFDMKLTVFFFSIKLTRTFLFTAELILKFQEITLILQGARCGP
jgi:hypothetical protein